MPSTTGKGAAELPEPEESVAFPDPASALPPEPRPFVGTEHLAMVKTLQHLVARPCVAGLFGPAGSGKTTLCEKLANTVESRRAFLRDEQGEPVHRRFWVDLEGCEPGAMLEQRVARGVGCSSFAAAIARLSNGQPSLVVLDSADDVWGAAGRDDPSLSRLIDCSRRGARIVVTMRAGGGPPFTAELEIPRLDGPTARMLFDTLAPDGGSAAPDVIPRCNGEPLAVTLLAKAAGTDPGSLAAAVTGVQGSTGVPLALAACAAHIDEPGRRAWTALSLFPAGLGRDDVSDVLAPLDRAEHHAGRLYQLGLARRTAAGLRVPEALRLPEPDPAQVAERWQRYTDRARHVVSLGGGGDWLVIQQANLAALVPRRPLPDGALELAAAGLLTERPAPAVDATENTLVALAAAAIADGAVPPLIVDAEAVLRDRYRITASQLLLSLMVEASRRTGDRQSEARALEALGTLAHRASEYGRAQALLSQAQEIAGDAADPVRHADVLFDQGRVALSQGNHGQAESLLSQAQEIYDTAGSRFGQASARLYRGQLAAEVGHDEQAEPLLSEARDIYDSIENPLGGANARLYLGQLAARADRYDQAEPLLSEAQDIYDSVGNQLGRANARLSRGDLANRQGRRPQAEALLSEAEVIYDNIGHRLGQANARIYRGELLATRGLFDQAEELFSVAQHIYDEIGDRRGQANARFDRGRVAEILGRDEQAAALLAEAREIYDVLAPPPAPERKRPRARRAQRVRVGHRSRRHQPGPEPVTTAEPPTSAGPPAAAGRRLDRRRRSQRVRARRTPHTAPPAPGRPKGRRPRRAQRVRRAQRASARQLAGNSRARSLR